MRPLQVLAGALAGLTGALWLAGIGSSMFVAGGAGVCLYIGIRWLMAWVGRVKYWYARPGLTTAKCPNCQSLRDRLGGDWVVECKRCGWRPSLPVVRWFRWSVPAVQLRRTIIGRELIVFAIAAIVVVPAVTTGFPIAGQQTPGEMSAENQSEGGDVPQFSDAVNDSDDGFEEQTAAAGHPYEGETLIVALEREQPTRADMTTSIQDSTEYWERNSELYAGFQVRYEFRPNADNPDILIRAVSDVSRCTDHDYQEVAGCAPLIFENSTAPSTAEIEVRTDLRQAEMTRVLKHEFGHTLGLQHEDEPQEVMSNEPEWWRDG